MPSPLLISEVTRRSLASLSQCHNVGNTPQAVEIMKAEIRQIAREVAHWHLSGEAKAQIFLQPMEEVLVNHYGSHNGRRLYWDYVDAFWLQSWSTAAIVAHRPDVVDNEEPQGDRRATG